MKKLVLLLLCPMLLLAGCGPLYTKRQEVEQLKLMETLGLDPAPEGVLVTLAASSGVGEGEAQCYSIVGASVSDALQRLQERSLADTLFCGHLQHILLGQKQAEEGLEGFLAYVCRSSDVRLDLPVYLLLDGSAQQAMTATGQGDKGIADALEALGLAREDGPRLSTAGTILRDLESRGSALVRTLRLLPAAEEGEDAAQTVAPEGYAVLIGGRLADRIGPEEAVAVALLTGTLRPTPLVLELTGGRRVTLELEEGSLDLVPHWDGEGKLECLELSLRVRAMVLELDGFDQLADEAARNALTARLEEELSRRVGTVLQLSRNLEADFLGLGSRVELASPLRGRGMSRDLGPLLPELRFSVSIQGELSHSNDMN